MEKFCLAQFLSILFRKICTTCSGKSGSASPASFPKLQQNDQLMDHKLLVKNIKSYSVSTLCFSINFFLNIKELVYLFLENLRLYTGAIIPQFWSDIREVYIFLCLLSLYIFFLTFYMLLWCNPETASMLNISNKDTMTLCELCLKFGNSSTVSTLFCKLC